MCFRAVLGSGICIFSQYPIIETVYQDFPLNGHAQKVFHGDWFGAKGCALAILKVKDYKVNMYATHVSVDRRVCFVNSVFKSHHC